MNTARANPKSQPIPADCTTQQARAMMPLPEALRVVQSVMARLIGQQAAELAELRQSKNAMAKLAATAELLKARNACVVSEWWDIKSAAYRYGCGDERMRQLAKSGAVVSRRNDGGPIFIETASLDARLRSIGREPRE
jgi:hypothetical protein